MTKIIVTGHGGYAGAVRGNLTMLMGEPEGFLFVDFNPGDDLNDLVEKLGSAAAACGEDEILFACDLAGGSPFRQSAILCIDHPERAAVCGLNPAAFCEMVYNLELPAGELADLAVQVTRDSILKFPG